MKIRSIRLAAYGPFTDATLDLPESGPDFHLVFGPNEAGKSTALRALRHMLFGIPTRTGDNFLHGYAQLRIGARLVNGAGDEIAFLRRKGQAKTLRGPDDETVLEDDALAPFLGGVGAQMFEQMFAIGHEDLIRGGEEIISGKGSVGEALFAAGAGLIRLQNVQKELDQACGALFKPSGSTPAINQAIKAVKNERRAEKDALLLPKTWKTHDTELRDARKRMDAVKKALADYKQQRARLARIGDALPLIARKKEIDVDLAVYQDVPDLADDFGDKRRDAERELKPAERDVARLQEAVEKIGQEIDALPDRRALLESAASVESLQHELGSFRKARQDRPGLEGRMRTLQAQATKMVDEIGADISGEAARDLNLPPSIVGEVRKLEKDHERLTARCESEAEQQRKRGARIGQVAERRRALSEPVDVSRLENALQPAREAGPIEKQLEEMQTANERIENELNRILKRQILWKGSLAKVDTLPLPSKETVDWFEDRFDALRRGLEKHREARAAAEKEIAQTRADIQAIDRSHNVPTEADLKDARGLRDKGWGLIRRQLEGRLVPAEASREIVDRFDDASDLTDAFEISIERADRVSDRLRREADQVSRKGLLESQKEKLEKENAAIATALEKFRADHSELTADWKAQWAPSGITPQTPKEMQAWLLEMEVLREKLAELQSRKSQAEILAGQLTALRSGMLRALEDVGATRYENASLSAMIQTARHEIQTQKELESAIASADREQIRLKAELKEGTAVIEDLKERFSRWKANWQISLGKLGIRPDATPTEAVAVIESIREVRNKTDEADVLRKRIEGIDRDSARFAARVKELVETLAPDLIDESPDRAAELLNGRLTRARKDASRHSNLAERLEASRNELADAEKRLFECRALIESLCKEARCTTAEELAATERQARERKALIAERSDLEGQLRKLSAGATVEAFIDEAASMEADRIDPELEELAEATETLEKERSELDQQIGALKARLEQMDGRSKAANHAENAEHLLAGLESDVERYARLKIASIILARTVERYREKHQGPLISRASELFARMTRDAFCRLRADYDDKGSPVLVGIRSKSEASVRVEGMSDGTADQLYLALRLASLEQYLENNEPLPFVVDDILLRFDDERALATLDVLAGLSEKTQVLFFTHHRHLVELVENAGKPHLKFRLHRL